MLTQQRNNLVIGSLCSAVGIIWAEVQAVCLCTVLLIWACGFTAACYKLPYKSLCRKPFFIITARQMTAVALIPIEQGKSNRLFLVCGKGVPSIWGSLFQGVSRFQRYARLNTERIFSVHKHTVFVFSRTACGIAVKDSTWIVSHRIAAAVIGVGKRNRAYIARSKRRCRRQNGQCRDRSHKSNRSLFE